MNVLGEALRKGRLDQSERLLTTPEGTALRFRLATRGDRVTALAIDLMILMAAFLGLLLGGGWLLSRTLGAGIAGFAVFAVLPQLLFFCLRWGYFIGMELGPRGATFGKRIMGLRVVSRDGRPLRAEAVVARNLMREIETFLPIIALFSFASGWAELFTALWLGALAALPWLNRDRMRGGDFVAGTWVVENPKPALLPDQAEGGEVRLGRRVANRAVASGYRFTAAQLNAYGEYELQVLEGVLRSEGRERARLLVEVARRVARKIDHAPPIEATPVAAEPFLRAFYAALRAHLEAARLAGRARADKHDGRGR